MFEYNMQEEKQGFHIESTVMSKFFSKMFLWMLIGLTITFVTAFYLRQGIYSGNQIAYSIVQKYFMFLIAEFILVLAFGKVLNSIGSFAAKILFLVYSFFSGITLGAILLAFGVSHIILALGLTVVVFGVMAGYGFITKKDLSQMKNMLMATIFTLLIVSVLNAFLFKSNFMYWIISYVGVLLFSAFTMYDINKIKNKIIQSGEILDEESLERYSIYGALQLYLDFINLFIFILRIVSGGKRR